MSRIAHSYILGSEGQSRDANQKPKIKNKPSSKYIAMPPLYQDNPLFFTYNI